jgi:hypothetical protein
MQLAGSSPKWQAMTSPFTGQMLSPVWRKSSHCVARECVEVATGRDGVVMVRDSAQWHGAVLQWSATEWRSLLVGIKGGSFDGRRP